MKTYLTVEDIHLLLQAATNLRDKLLILMLFRLGCRVTEVLRLTANDIDFEAGTVRIEHLKSKINITCPHCNARLARSSIFCSGCGNKVTRIVSEAKEHKKMRTIPLDPETLEMLKEYIDRGGPVEKDGRLMIFGITRNTAWRVVSSLARKARLPMLINPESGKMHNVSPHRLRDAFAVHAVKKDDSGDGLRLLQEHLGHTSFNTTAKYRKISGEEQREWYSKLWEDQEQHG